MFFLKTCRSTDETLFFVDIEFLVIGCYSDSRDVIEVTYFCSTFMTFTVFSLDFIIEIDGIVNDMVEVVFYFFYLIFNIEYLFFRLLDIEF